MRFEGWDLAKGQLTETWKQRISHGYGSNSNVFTPKARGHTQVVSPIQANNSRQGAGKNPKNQVIKQSNKP